MEPAGAKVAPVDEQSKRSNSLGVAKDKKFGHLSSKMSVSAMSMGGESKVAFSDANYMA